MALIVNGTTQSATADLTVPYIMSGEITFTGTFRTGASVTGSERVSASIRTVSGNYRGLNFRIGADGYFKVGSNTTGSDAFGTTPWLGVAQPNTSYRFLVKKDVSGNLTGYINSLSTTYTRSTVSNTYTLTKILMSATSGTGAPHSFFNGQLARVAIFNSALSDSDVAICLSPSTTPMDCSVAPIEYWPLVGTAANSVGVNSATLLSGASIDSDAIVGQTVTSINSGAAIPAGSANVPAVTTGFTGLPISITTNASGVTCSNISGSINAPTFDVSDRVDGGLYPKNGTSVQFTFTNGSESASLSQTVVKKSDETLVVVSSPLFTANTIANAILSQTGRTIATGDEIYHTVYDDLSITADTDYTVTSLGSFTMWLWVSSGADAGKMYFYNVAISEGGIVINGGFTSSGLTSSGLTNSGLTSIGL
jgi:hypothetical protein